MLALLHQATFFTFLISFTLVLSGCGGSNSNNQRSAKSNPFAPSNGNFAPARPQKTLKRPKTKQRQQSPSKNSNTISQHKTNTVKKTPKPKVNGNSNQTNIITETSKRTLDSNSPGVAIIVRGVSGDEPLALPILQKEIRSSILNPSTNNLQKQGVLTESSQQDFENFVFNKQLVLVVRPVPNDLFAFAQKLNWGKVKEIDLQNRIITVDTQLQQLNSTALKKKTAPMQSEPPVKISANTNSLKSNAAENPNKPTMKTSEKKPANSNDRDLKPRPGEETIDWALRVIAGSSPFAHDTACKELARMKPDDNQLQRVSSVLAATLPLAKEGFRMKEHVNAMAVWYTKEATMAFAVLLADEKSVLVREEIIELLPKIHSETTAEVLAGRLSNREDLKDARQALKIMGQIAEKPVIRLLNHPDSSLRIEACKILQSIGTQEAVEALKIRAEVEESNVVKQLLSETQAGIQTKLSKPEK